MIFGLKKKIALVSDLTKAMVFIFTIALILDVVVLGNGKWSEVLMGFSFRKVIFFLLTVSLILYFSIEKALREEVDYFLILLPMVFFFVWSLCIPLIYGRVFEYQYTGNYDAILTGFRSPSSLKDFIFILNLSIKESSVLIAFSTLPLIAVFFRNNCILWAYVKNIFFISLLLLMAIHLKFVSNLLICDYYQDYVCSHIMTAYSLYDATSENALNLVRPIIYDQVTNTYLYRPLRFSIVSSIFMGVLVMFPIFINFRRLSSKFVFFLIMLCVTVAIFYTGLRGMLLAGIFGLIVFLFLRKNLQSFYDKIYRLVFIAITLAVSIVFIASSSNLLSYFGLARLGSDSIRYEQGYVLIGEIFKYPLFGNGFGSVIEGYQRLFSFEQYILALVMKVGIVGLALFYIYMKRWIEYYQIRDYSSLSKEDKNRYIGNTIGITSIFVLSASNPYLMNFVGFVFILFFVVDHSVLTSKNNSNN